MFSDGGCGVCFTDNDVAATSPVVCSGYSGHSAKYRYRDFDRVFIDHRRNIKDYGQLRNSSERDDATEQYFPQSNLFFLLC